MIYLLVGCMALFGPVLFVFAFISMTDGDYAGALRSVGGVVLLLVNCWLLFRVLRGKGRNSELP